MQKTPKIRSGNKLDLEGQMQDCEKKIIKILNTKSGFISVLQVWVSCMVIRVVEFSSGGDKNRKIFA